MKNCYAYYVGYSGFKADQSGGYIAQNGIVITDENKIQMNIDTDTMMFSDTGQLQAKTQLSAGDGVTISDTGAINILLSANNTLKFVTDSPESQKLRIAGNYQGVQGISITGNTISAAIDGTTIQIVNGKLTSTQQFQAGDGIKIIEKVLDETKPEIITRYLQLNIDGKTLVYDENRNLRGNYTASAPLSLSGADSNALTLNYDPNAFQLITDTVTNQQKLSLKQLFSQGQGIRITADPNNTTKQLLSVAVDGTTVKIVDGVLVSQKLTAAQGNVVSISDDNKISVGYDNITIKNINGKLQSGLTVTAPILLSNNTNIGLSYDTNTLAVSSTGALTAKQGIISAGTGITVTPGENSTSIISANIDNNTIVVDSNKKLSTNYTFAEPLNYTKSTGQVRLNIDNLTIVSTAGKLTGNYKAGDGITINNNIISTNIDNDTIKYTNNKLSSTQLFKAGDGVKITTESGQSYLGLSVDETTMIIDANKALKGNYTTTAPLSLTGNTIALNYDVDAFQLIDNKLSLKQLFTAGTAIKIEKDTADASKQKISVLVDGTTVKLSNGKLSSQFLVADSAGPISISNDNKISVGYDNITIKFDELTKKLKGNYTATAPLSLSAGSTTVQPALSLKYDSNTLQLTTTNLLQAKQGTIVAGQGIATITDTTTKQTTISAKIDGTTVKVNSTGQLYANFTFTQPLSRNTTSGAVSLLYDTNTLKVINSKLTGNYTAGAPLALSSTAKYTLNYDTAKFKLNSSNQLTTIDNTLKGQNGITLTSVTDSSTKITTHTFSANVDDNTLFINDEGQIAVKYPATVYYYPFTLQAYTTTAAFYAAAGNTAKYETLYLLNGSHYRSMTFNGEYVDLDSNLKFIRRTNTNLGYNFKGIDYRATCTATSFGVLCRNTNATPITNYTSIKLNSMPFSEIFIDVPDTATTANTITFPDEITFGISTIFVQLSSFTGSLTFTDKTKCVGVYGTLTSALTIDAQKYKDYYNGVAQ